MKSPHDSEISSGKAATSGSANILNTSRFAYRSVLNMTFFLSAPTKPVFNVCAQNASPQDDTFFLSILVVCFPFMEVLPISWVGYCSYKPEVLGKHLLLMSFQYIFRKN